MNEPNDNDPSFPATSSSSSPLVDTFYEQTSLSPGAASKLKKHEYQEIVTFLGYTPYQQAHVWIRLQKFQCNQPTNGNNNGDDGDDDEVVVVVDGDKNNMDASNDDDGDDDDADDEEDRTGGDNRQVVPDRVESLDNGADRITLTSLRDKNNVTTGSYEDRRRGSATEERHSNKRRKKEPNTNITESRWLQAVRHAKNFYRIRLFVDRARCKETDRYGQKPSLWALNHGMIVDGLREVLLEGLAAQMNPSTRTVEASVILQALQTNERPSTTPSSHWSMAKTFCTMKPGDIVSMIIPGPKLKSVVAFGVIEESFFHVRTIQDYESELNFPIPRDLADVYPTLLGRKVKWYRKCFVRDLPGQLISKKGDRYVKWILETSPGSIFDITSTKYGTRDHLTSTKFLQNSTRIRHQS